jgi:hypothetical protein
MRVVKRFVEFLAAALCLVMAGAVVGQAAAQSRVGVPKNAIALEGTPLVRIDANEDQVTRRQLTEAEIARSRLTINVDHDKYVWTSRGNLPLTVSSAGAFTYLSSSEPGKYVRFGWANGRITYVEHVDMAHGSVTYWGELRIVLGK